VTETPPDRDWWSEETWEYPVPSGAPLGTAAAAGEEPVAVFGRPPDPVLTLQRMESALVRADLEHPGAVAPADVRRLRYLLGFARLTAFQPGAAERGGRTDRRDVEVTDEVAGLRDRVIDELEAPLRREADPGERLRRAVAALDGLREPLAEARRQLVERHAGDFSAGELDAEVGRRLLVNVAGGGGGAGYVYLGAYARLQEQGIVPGYIVGASIGALLGIFRARAAAADWENYLAMAKLLDRRELLALPRLRRRFGLPGLLSLELIGPLGEVFRRADGGLLRIGDLEIPYEALVAGVRRRSFERLPRRFRRTQPSPASASAAPTARRSPARLGPAIASRMWQVAAFFDPRLVKPVVLGADSLTEDLVALHAAGFSAAIPGVLHYDIEPEDERTTALLAELFDREDLAALVDGGLVSNVPAELAWRRVHAGRLGTRNAVYLVFDCFHPQWDPAHLWLQPITQALQLQMARNAPYADWIVRFEPTLSPINLVPEPDRFDAAVQWGREAIEQRLPLIERLLEPVAWEG
jgi:predicted acylesterase/phospholipase RssA